MIVDILVVFVLAASSFISFLRGFIREILTIFGIVGGGIAAYIGGPLLVPHMSKWLGVVPDADPPQKLFDVLPYPILAEGLSYVLIFIVFVVILSFISHMIAEFAKSIGLGPLDRTLGVVFGIARGVLLLGLLYLPFFYLLDPETKQTWFEGSKTHIYLETAASAISGFLPSDTKEKLQQSAEKIDATNQAREKLQEMNVLNGEKPQEGQAQPQATDAEKKEGYSSDFREKMNELIDQKALDVTPMQPPANEEQDETQQQPDPVR